MKEISVAVEQHRAELGMLLTDLTFKLIASDRGAAAILGQGDTGVALNPARSETAIEVAQAIGSAANGKPGAVCLRLRIRGREYRCRVFRIEDGVHLFPQPLLAVYLERDWSGDEVVSNISEEYHLTQREQQVLRGIATGLSTKELAERMGISPNTVKAFVRLITIKVGVTSRGELVARLLYCNGHH